MKNCCKLILFSWVSGILFFCTISCGQKINLGPAIPVAQDVKSQLVYGERLYAEGRYDQAADVFRDILKYDSDNVSAHYRIGVIYWKQGDLEKSAGEFLNVVSINNTHHKAFYNLGVFYSLKGPLHSVQQAADNFNRYLTLDPYCENRKQIIDWLQSHGQKFDRIEPKIGMNENDSMPEDEVDMISQADTYIKQQAFDKAESLYKAVLERNPTHSIAFYKLGVMYMKQGAFVSGRTALLKAISIDPGFSKAYFNLGLLYSTKGETYDAEKAGFFFKKYVTIEPDAPQIEKIEAWLIKHDSVNAGRFFRNNLQAPGRSFSNDDSPSNFKSWLVDQSSKISNVKGQDE